MIAVLLAALVGGFLGAWLSARAAERRAWRLYLHLTGSEIAASEAPALAEVNAGRSLPGPGEDGFEGHEF